MNYGKTGRYCTFCRYYRRYFLRFATDVLSLGETPLNALNIYSTLSDRTIVIEGVIGIGMVASVYDLLGRKVGDGKRLDVSLNKQVLDANKLSSGIYVVALENGNQKVTQKVILK